MLLVWEMDRSGIMRLVGTAGALKRTLRFGSSPSVTIAPDFRDGSSHTVTFFLFNSFGVLNFKVVALLKTYRVKT